MAPEWEVAVYLRVSTHRCITDQWSLHAGLMVSPHMLMYALFLGLFCLSTSVIRVVSRKKNKQKIINREIGEKMNENGNAIKRNKDKRNEKQ
uniref:Uncharacterized protein n=1 Tax=Romanomermis culicivorax TaxID=13658 RepID=A0A915IND7_ROMCU